MKYEFKYKRQYRDLNDQVKRKISDATRGKAKSSTHKEHIRQGMLKYWSGVEWRNRKNNETDTCNNESEV